MSDPTAFADAIQQWNDLFSFGQRFRMNQAAWMRDQRRSGRPNAELWRNVESNGWLCSKQPTTPDDIVGTNSCELETAYRAAGSRLSMSEARFAVLLAAVDWMPEHDWKSLGLTYDCGPSFKRIKTENGSGDAIDYNHTNQQNTSQFSAAPPHHGNWIGPDADRLPPEASLPPRPALGLVRRDHS